MTMETLESLKKKLTTAEDLRSVVKTMKALAAANIRQYERAVESLAEYSRTIEMGLQILLRGGRPFVEAGRATSRTDLGAVIFGSQQGLAGQFNEQIAEYTVGQLAQAGSTTKDPRLLAVGQQVVHRLAREGRSIDDQLPLPNSVSGITTAVQKILLHIERWREESPFMKILVFHHRPKSKASYRPRMMALVPIDQDWLQELREREWSSPSLPTHTMERSVLLASVIRQHLFISLYRAIAESLASENASRLAAMQAAERNIEERIEALRSRYHHRRQSAITAELLDIVSGFEALTGAETDQH
jgi:F-type H+-transporting ATPase subunit gamma